MNDPIMILGAGKTGRGFLARLLSEQGYPVILIDRDPQTVARIRDGYRVHFYGSRPSLGIAPLDAVHTEDPKATAYVRSTHRIFVSVGIKNLEAVGNWLADKVSSGSEIYLCENGSTASSMMERCLERTKARVFPAAVFCTTIEGRGADIDSEEYDRLFCGVPGGEQENPWAPFLEYVENFPALMTRKLYTYNAASAIICYLGCHKGYKAMAEAANDSGILKKLDAYYPEIGAALCREYGYTQESQDAFAEASRRKFTNKKIRDSIARNARNPWVKLEPGERIMGPVRLLEKYGGDTEILAETAAAALAYGEDETWRRRVLTEGIDTILGEICRLRPEEPFYRLTAKYYEKLSDLCHR